MDLKDRFRQFIFGHTSISESSLSAKEAERLISEGARIGRDMPLPSEEKLIALFGRLSKAWRDPMYHRRREAFDILVKNSGLGPELIATVLNKFPSLISPETLRRKIEGELGDSSILDTPVLQGSTNARLICRPAGLVLHVASGNVFLACIDSLIDGIITKNVNFLKMSTENRDFPPIFAESIKEFDTEGVVSGRLAVLWWQGGEEAVENLFKQEMDRIMFWGGYDSLLSWKKGLGQKTILIQHGPKVSFGVISRAGLERAALGKTTDALAFDVAIWEQKACNCPQMVFVEESVPEEKMKSFLDSLAESFKKTNQLFPPAARSDDEYVEVLKTREVALAKHLLTGEPIRTITPETFDWTIIYEEKTGGQGFDLSPLNRTILVKRYKSLKTLTELFGDQSFYLQTVGYCLEDSEIPEYAKVLSALGVTRICPFGIMAIPTPGTPHDGSYALRDLTRFTVIE